MLRRRLFCTLGSPPPVANALTQMFLSGSGRKRTGRGQPRAVIDVTGGGGHLLSWMLSTPGASSCLLEARVPYAKASVIAHLTEHGRGVAAEAVGYCSEDMAALQASAARDRALMLTPLLSQWKDCVGVAVTATIVSHYKRRGGYRAHAASCDGSGNTYAYTHALVKGARERTEEDEACALLALRALADAVGVEGAAALATHGVRLAPAAEATNAVGETAPADAAESVPERREWSPPDSIRPPSTVLVPTAEGEPPDAVPMPLDGVLPPSALLVPWDESFATSAPLALHTPDALALAAAEALSVLLLDGDGGGGTWSEPPAPVLFEAPNEKHALQAFLANTGSLSLLRPSSSGSGGSGSGGSGGGSGSGGGTASGGDGAVGDDAAAVAWQAQHSYLPRLGNWGIVVPAAAGDADASVVDATLRGQVGHGSAILLSPTAVSDPSLAIFVGYPRQRHPSLRRPATLPLAASPVGVCSAFLHRDGSPVPCPHAHACSAPRPDAPP